ncbi:MAG: hypothetical protein V9G20_17810 [Candidatus Promineifilaceae bacterium]
MNNLHRFYKEEQILNESEFIKQNWESHYDVYKMISYGGIITIGLLAIGTVAAIIGHALGFIVAQFGNRTVETITQVTSALAFLGILFASYPRLPHIFRNATQWSEKQAKDGAKKEYHRLLRDLDSLSKHTYDKLDRFGQAVKSNRITDAYNIHEDLPDMLNKLDNYRNRLFKDATAFSEWDSTYKHNFEVNKDLSLQFEEIRHNRRMEQLEKERIRKAEELAKENNKVGKRDADAISSSAEHFRVMVKDKQGQTILDWRQPFLGKLEILQNDQIKKTNLWGQSEIYILERGQQIKTKKW